MKLMKNKKYLQQKFSWKVLVPKTTAAFTLRVSKSYVPFTCKIPMVMYFVLILHKRCRSKTNFYVFSNDKTSLIFCASFRFVLAVFMEKFQNICYLSYARKRVDQYVLVKLYMTKRDFDSDGYTILESDWKIDVCKTLMSPLPQHVKSRLELLPAFWPTDLNIIRDHLPIKDYLPTNFEASGAKCSWAKTEVPRDVRNSKVRRQDKFRRDWSQH